jgi:hypothetical protein
MNAREIIARCDEGLARLRADLAKGGPGARGCENRIAALEKTRADAVEADRKAAQALVKRET